MMMMMMSVHTGYTQICAYGLLVNTYFIIIIVLY